MYSLQQLSELTELPVRTIRFYIQKELVDRPIGERKAAKYSEKHLEQCLKVKKWTEAGLSLSKVAEAMATPPSDVPTPKKKPGEVQMITSIHIADGVSLQIDNETSELSPKQIKTLSEQLIKLIENNNG